MSDPQRMVVNLGSLISGISLDSYREFGGKRAAESQGLACLSLLKAALDHPEWAQGYVGIILNGTSETISRATTALAQAIVEALPIEEVTA